MPSTNKPGRRPSGFLDAQQAGLQQRISAAVNYRRNQLNEGRKPARRQLQRRRHPKTRHHHNRRRRVMRLRRHRHFRRTARHSPRHRSTRRLPIRRPPGTLSTRRDCTACRNFTKGMMRTILHPRHRRGITLRSPTLRARQIVPASMRHHRQRTPHHASQHANPQRDARSHNRPQ